ncbi:MAG: gamma-glutamyl-gamma-aminobutyrate hydrolase family protein, partial [Chlamydiia bacterium]|nr:gamma-glutamyl-gamma-aminobutyrate hydrolase family protein [Chlamydiia bacterium]
VKNEKRQISKKSYRISNFAIIDKTIKRIIGFVLSLFGYNTKIRTSDTLKNDLYNDKRKKKTLSENKLLSMIEKSRESNIDLKEVLKSNGYSTVVENLEFSSTFEISKVDFTGITFRNCKFERKVFTEATLKGVSFENCSFENVSFMNTTFDQVSFRHCDIFETMFTGAKLNQAFFLNSSLTACSFEDATLERAMFSHSSLQATHFLEASIKGRNAIKNCDLTDTVFFGTFEHFQVDKHSEETLKQTAPLSAILVDPESRGVSTPKAYMLMDQLAHIIPLRITLKAQKTTKEQVNREVEEALALTNPKTEEPIPQQLLKRVKEDRNTYSDCAKIIEKSEKILKEVDSIFLPGGEDVPPALYGEPVGEHTNWGGDYRRSILELSLIHHAFQKGIPLMAICRGYQMSSVYFGANLIQDISGQKGTQTFVLNRQQGHQGLYAQAMRRPLVGAVFHHQAVGVEGKPREHVEPSVIYDGMVKATELKYSGGVPMIQLQFHPEFYQATTAHSMGREWADGRLQLFMSDENRIFWDIFSASNKTRQSKKTVMEEIKQNAPKDRTAAIAAIEEKRQGRDRLHKRMEQMELVQEG